MGYWVVVLARHHFSPWYLHYTSSLQEACMVAHSAHNAFDCHAWIESGGQSKESKAWTDAAMSARARRVSEHRKQIGAH
jgi:hypothetical protein